MPLFALRMFACLLLVVLAVSATRAQEAAFTHDAVQEDAKRYEAHLKLALRASDKQGSELRAEGLRLLAAGTDFREASRALAQAVIVDGRDAESWLGLAQALLRIAPAENSERYMLPVNASGAAWNAYERAQSRAAKAEALLALHEALKRRSYWRPAIAALRASVALVDNAGAREALETLVAQHGFRITEYKADADGAQP